jgi:hypothetical protein
MTAIGLFNRLRATHFKTVRTTVLRPHRTQNQWVAFPAGWFLHDQLGTRCQAC